MMIRILTIGLIALTLNAAVLPDPWSVDVRKHSAVDRVYKQGETIDMRVTVQEGFSAYDLTGARAVFYWFTNSLGNVWWTNAVAITTPKTGVLSVRWTPAMDVGALSYPYWIGIWPSGSTSPVWRITGTIKLLPSPGFVPNSLMPPVRMLDVGAVTVTNAPWLKSSDWQSGSNALAEALQSVSGIASGAAALSESNRQAIAALPPPTTSALRLVTPDGTQWRDATGAVWRVIYSPITNIVCTLSNPFGRIIAPDMFDRPEQSVFVGAYGTQIDAGNSWFVSFDAQNDGFYTVYNAFSGDTWSVSGQNPPTVANPEDGTLFGTAAFTYQVTYVASTSRIDTVALLSDLDALPKPSSDALRLVNTNAVSWIDGDGNRWRITQQAVTNDHQLIMFNSNFDWFGVVTINRVFELNEWSAIPESDVLFYAGDVYQEGIFYTACWNTEYDQASYSACLPSDLTTFPKTYSNPINGHTGWVDRVISYQAVTSKWAEVANKSDILPPIPAAFTNVPLYTLSGSNYYWRWSIEQGTYVTTGVPQ